MKIEFPDDYKYNLDAQIAHLIVRGIPTLRGQGFPGGLSEKEWNDILDEIEEGFQDYLDHKYDWPFDSTKIDKAMELLNEWFAALWW